MISRNHLARFQLLFALALIATVALPGVADAQQQTSRTTCNPMINVDNPMAGATVSGWSMVNGWAVDTLEAALSSGIDSVQVYLDNEAGSGGTLLGIATMGNKPGPGTLPAELLRTDVDRSLSRSNNKAGWVLWYDFSTVTPGSHSLIVYAETKCGFRNTRVNFTVAAGGPTTPPPAAMWYLQPGQIPAATGTSQAVSYGQTGYNGYAQSTVGLVVRAERVPQGGTVSGQRTFVGVALDCNTYRGSDRVRVYDNGTTYGSAGSGMLLGEAALGGTRNTAQICPGPSNQFSPEYYSGAYNVGFTISVDTTRLADGQHTLAFVADFPNGSATDTISVYVDNSRRCDTYYGGYNGGYNGSYNDGYYGGNGNYNCNNRYNYNRYSNYSGYNGYNNGYNTPYNYGGVGQYCIAYGSVTGRCLVYSSTPTNYLNNCNTYPGYANGIAGYLGTIGYPGTVGYPGTIGAINNPYYTGSVTCVTYPGLCTNGVLNGGIGGYNGLNCPFPTTPTNLNNCVYFPQLCATNVTNTITLAQANTAIAKNTIVPLTGTVACPQILIYPAPPNVNTVTVMDITVPGTPLTVGSVTATNGTFIVNYNTTGLGGTTRILQVMSTGTCGTATQQFTLTVLA